jgi:hypothetical protein
MKTIQCLLLSILAVCVQGCKSTFHVQHYQPPASKVSPDAAVFIIVPPDAYDEPGSGRVCADTLQEAFRPYANRIKKSEEIATLNIHLTNAANLGFKLVLEPTIYHWEEEPTEWTGKPDFLDIRLRLLQAPSGDVVSETRFDGKSKWGTFGGDHVDHLLKPLASEWVRSLYEGTEFKVPGSGNQKKQ